MENQDNHRYDDIINLPNPTSKKHPRMSLYDRAAQFRLLRHLLDTKQLLRKLQDRRMKN